MASPVVELLVTGDEVLRGTVADTNSALTAARLHLRGLTPRTITVIGDSGDDIRRALLEIAARAELCIVSGGLGPTSDDLTAACAAQAAGVPLRLDQPWLDGLRARWAKRRGAEPMPQNNERQAWLPEGAELLGNPDGTAPAFALRLGRCAFFFLPGVPREHHRIVDELLLPRLERELSLPALASLTLRCTGIAESKLDQTVAPIRLAHPEIRFGFRTHFPENHLSLAARGGTLEEAGALLAPVAQACREALGAHVYSERDETFAQATGSLLVARRETLACAESCTGGLLAQLCTDFAGSSRFFAGGFVTYSNELKMRALGVREETLRAHGAVSEETAREMAAGARERSGASWALSITGIAGPDGGTPEKPVGTVCFGLAGAGLLRTITRQLRGDRDQIRLQSAYAALELLREAAAKP